MICISVTPRSRTLAKVDLLNASTRGDLIELCLDYLIKEPDIGDLLKVTHKPILISCRSPADGGGWQGTEEERVRLLRQAIVAGPAYVELDFEIAGSIPRYGETKRVISYSSRNRPLHKVDDIFAEAKQLQADVVKFTWPTPTLETAWPLLAAVSQKREIPVVGHGIGEGNIMLSLLGRKFGFPWISAALEKGMESHEGQPTVFELEETFGWGRIDARTRFVGLVAYSREQEMLARVLNAGFDLTEQPLRCLPLPLGKMDHLPKMLEILHLNCLIVGTSWGARMLSLANQPEPAVKQSLFCDLFLKQSGEWHSYHLLWRSAIQSIEAALKTEEDPEKHPLDRKNVLVLGAGGLARVIAYGLRQRKGMVSISSPDDSEAQQAAQMAGVRHIPFAAVYSTLTDLVILADGEIPLGHKRDELNPAILRHDMVFADLTRIPLENPLTAEARLRGCKVIEPADIQARQITSVFHAITGKELPPDAWHSALSD